ncbi:MAG TPA: guanylate kinase [Ruminococcaceae bacterium]|nr:guanylate kinase [Oscillospiraceae bacterium]HCT16831.1 guanylate kinase [Oscillospiraceae bacterium]
MKNNGMLVVLSGPAGSGKDTVISELFKSDFDITKSVSMTTRKPRDGETDGIDYMFVSEEDFLDAVENGELLEYARYGVNYYGTPKGPVDKWLEDGHIVILKIDVEGAGNIRKMYPDTVSIFIMPPSMQILEKRLRDRGSEDEEDVLRRLKIAFNEIERCRNEYDYVVINDDLQDAVDDIKTIINAEKHKVSRCNIFLSEVCKNV